MSPSREETVPMASAWRRALAVATVSSLLAGGAHAAIVSNGGFETGDFTGWTLTGPTDNAAVVTGALDLGSPTDGTHMAAFGPMSDTTELSQDLGELFGEFTLSFDLSGHLSTFVGSGIQTGSDFYSTICCVVSPEGQDHYVFGFTGKGHTVINFIVQSFVDSQYVTLDNVVVDRISAPAPEPAGWALTLVGFGLGGGALRRARRAAHV